MKRIIIKDGNKITDTIELKDDIDLKYVSYAISEYGENNEWFDPEDWYCVKCGKSLNPKYDDCLCSTCAGERK